MKLRVSVQSDVRVFKMSKVTNNPSFVSVIFTILSFISFVESKIQCYKCTIIPPSIYTNETERLCSNFDHSNRYIVDCEFSTLCMKKSYSIDLNGAIIQGVQRDCAPQKYKYHALVKGKWEMQSTIEEPYTEGCKFEDDRGARFANTQYCYCRGYLCNAAPSLDDSSYHVDAICVIFVYNALKLFHSFR